MILCEYFKPLLDGGRCQIADTMKVLVYQESPNVFEKIDFENDKAFLDPLLFSYFNRNQDYLIENILSKYYQNQVSTHNTLSLTNGIEVFQTQHPLITNRFEDMNNGNFVEAEIENTAKYHFDNLQTGFNIIENYLPILHTELLKTNRSVILYYST